MIDPSFDTLTPEKIHPFPPTMQELEQRYRDLEKKLTDMENDRNFWQGKAHERQLMIDNLEEYVKDQFDYIDENISQSLVDIFGLTITKEYDVQVTVTFSGTLSAPLDYDMDELENALEARLDTSYYSPSDLVIDLSEDSMDIDWTEN
jgi:hypothetical protein